MNEREDYTSIAGFLLARFGRLPNLDEALRAQRHVNHSITTLRLSLSYALIARLGQCPCCGRASAKLLL